MQLLWLHYRGKNPRYILCLELARQDGKIYCIETNKIDPGARNKIISAKNLLSNLSLGKKVIWLKQHCPSAMVGFKTLKESNANVIQAHKVNNAINFKNGK